MYDLGSNQILKYHATPESSYGQIIGSPTFVPIGVVTDGGGQHQTDITQIFGVGAKSAQATFPKMVENSLRATIFAPSAAVLNLGIPDGSTHELDSFNFVVGADDGASNVNVWLGNGLKIDSMQLEVDEENPLQATFDGIFQSKLSQTLDGVEGHTPTGIHIWRFDGLALTVGPSGSLVADAEKARLSISVRNNLQRKGMTTISDGTYGDHYRVCQYLREGNLEIEATVASWNMPAIDLEAATFGCADSLALSAIFTDLCDDATTPATLTIALTGGNFMSLENPLTPNEYPEYTYGMRFSAIAIS